jgi:citrate synthase
MTELFPGFAGVAGYRTAVSEVSTSGALPRYRDVPLERLLDDGTSYDDVWRLLVGGDGRFVLPPGIPAPDGRPPWTQLQTALAGQAGDLRHPADRAELVAMLSGATATLGVLVGGLVRQATGLGPPVDPARFVPGMSSTELLVTAWLGEPEPTRVRVLDRMRVVGAEHGSTASTFITRVAASTGAHPVAALVAGLVAFSGPRHGGAVTAVLECLRDIADRGGDPREWAERRIASGGRLPGIGHRVYREVDPRVPYVRQVVADLPSPLVRRTEEYTAAAVEAMRAAGKGRRACVNLDAWAGVAHAAIGVPEHLIACVMATGRSAGWCAHVVEQVCETRTLIRPSDIPARPEPAPETEEAR